MIDFNESQWWSYEKLVEFQLKGKDIIHFEDSYPKADFDRDAMMWDLQYFKYYVLKLARVPFDEQALENDFRRLVDFLCQAESHYFLFRDFQL